MRIFSISTLQCVAFHDINPKAPTHFLVIPKKPIRRLAEASEEDENVSVLPAFHFSLPKPLYEGVSGMNT